MASVLTRTLVKPQFMFEVKSNRRKQEQNKAIKKGGTKEFKNDKNS